MGKERIADMKKINLKDKINVKKIMEDSKEKRRKNKKVLRHGSYSMAVTGIVIASVVVLNLVVQELPSKFREIDLSSQKLYTIGEQTEKMLKKLDKDVQIYFVAQDGTESSDIEKLLERYEEGSKHVQVEQKDPAVNPTFVLQYTSDNISNNSVIVVCGDKSKVIDYTDMYETTINYSTYSQQVTGFDGEGQLTSALNYVVSEDMPVLYTLEGHEEASMSETMKETIQKANIDIQSLNLLTEEAVPEDTECLFIFAPAKDLSEDEADKVISYLENGGKAFIVSNYTDEDMSNFNRVLENYGVRPVNGIVFEGDSDHFVSQNPYYLLPNIENNEITSQLSSQSRYVLAAMAQGISQIENVRDSLEISSILSTTDSSYSKTDLENMETMEKEEGDIQGPFDLGVMITEKVDDEKETQIVYFSSQSFFDDSANAMVSGTNYELLSASLGWMCNTDETNTVSIPSKSYDNTSLVIPAADANFWSIFVTAMLPLCVLALGFAIWMKRRKQ
nr:GldG family protein [uncultured Blautia sp.]